jgi:hypothetical protein
VTVEVDQVPSVTGLAGGEFKLLKTVLEPTLVLGRIDGEPYALRGGLVRVERQRDVTAVVVKQLVNP